MKPIKGILIKIDANDVARASEWLRQHKHKVTRRAVWELLRSAAYEGVDDLGAQSEEVDP